MTTRLRYQRRTRHKRRAARHCRAGLRGGNSAIRLQPHQILPTHTLTTTDQPGVLLWYMMGTGKTFTAITLILNYPDRVVNIACPEDLAFVWKTELERVPQITNTINYYTYENIDTLFSRKSLEGELLIMDEVHNLVFSKIRSSANVGNIIALLRTSYKRLLLSGTPLYQDIIDLVYMVNLCSKTNVVPYNVSEFDARYRSVRPITTAIWGYILPITKILSSTTAYISGAASAGVLGYVYYTAKDIVKIDISSPQGVIKTMATSKTAIEKIATDTGFIQDVEKLIKKGVSKAEVAAIHEREVEAVMEYVSSMDGLTNHAFIAFKLITAATTIMCITGLLLYFVQYKLDDYYYLNIPKIAKDISPYTYYYTIDSNKNEYFPSTVLNNQIVSYSWFQMNKWMELTQGLLKTKDVAALDIATKESFVEHSKKIDLKTYLEHGTAIGNLSDDTGMYSPKFFAILEKAKGKRAVFYSRFVDNGSALFVDFLKSQGHAPHYISKGLSQAAKSEMLNEFYYATGECFIVLHPAYSEGISIRGAEQIHLIEPIPLRAQKAQVVARVVRFLSHDHLPPAKRNVHVYQWGCSASGWITSLQKFASSVKTWAKLATPMFWTLDYTTFDQDCTPDQVIMAQDNIAGKDETQLTDLLSRVKRADPDCCIKYPNDKQEAECRATRRACK